MQNVKTKCQNVKTKYHVIKNRQCPYIKGQKETLKIILPSQNNKKQIHTLMQNGFRRNADILYKPICNQCNQCTSLRVDTEKINIPNQISKSLKRIWKKNSDIKVKIMPPLAIPKHYRLFRQYIKKRHPNSQMIHSNFEHYKKMIENNITQTFVVEFSDLYQNLIAVAISDITENGISMVYDFFKTDQPKRGIGNFIILKHMQIAQNMKRKYLYLGYTIQNIQNMNYKTRFKPQQILTQNGWMKQNESHI